MEKVKERSLSDKNKKNDSEEFSSFGPQNLEVYQTREFEEARSFSGEKEDFAELEVTSDDDSFVPFGGVKFDDEPKTEEKTEQPVKDGKNPGDDKFFEDGDKKEKSRIDALSIIVEEEKKEAYEKGFEEGKASAKAEIEKKIIEENNKALEEEKIKGFEEGRIQGYEAGKNEALEEGKKNFNELNEKFIELLESLSNSWRNVIEKYEDEIVGLSLKMAKKVLYSNLTLDSDFVKLAIKEALKDIPDPLNVTIGVNPEDYNIIEMIKEDFFLRFEKLKNITIVSDPSIGRGGCTIDSETGTVVQTVENRLKELEIQILKNASSRKTS